MQWVILMCHIQVSQASSKPEKADNTPQPEETASRSDRALDISFDDDAKPVRKKPVLGSRKRVAAKTTEEDVEVPTETGGKEGGGEGEGNDTLLDFSFDDNTAAKPRRKKPVLSSTKNPPKRRSKKDGGEGDGEAEPVEKKREEETEEQPKAKPPAKKVCMCVHITSCCYSTRQLIENGCIGICVVLCCFILL